MSTPNAHRSLAHDVLQVAIDHARDARRHNEITRQTAGTIADFGIRRCRASSVRPSPGSTPRSVSEGLGNDFDAGGEAFGDGAFFEPAALVETDFEVGVPVLGIEAQGRLEGVGDVEGFAVGFGDGAAFDVAADANLADVNLEGAVGARKGAKHAGVHGAMKGVEEAGAFDGFVDVGGGSGGEEWGKESCGAGRVAGHELDAFDGRFGFAQGCFPAVFEEKAQRRGRGCVAEADLDAPDVAGAMQASEGEQADGSEFAAGSDAAWPSAIRHRA